MDGFPPELLGAFATFSVRMDQSPKDGDVCLSKAPRRAAEMCELKKSRRPKWLVEFLPEIWMLL